MEAEAGWVYSHFLMSPNRNHTMEGDLWASTSSSKFQRRDFVSPPLKKEKWRQYAWSFGCPTQWWAESNVNGHS